MYLQSVAEHPWFGVGIGAAGAAGTESTFAEFLTQKLRTGGHGAYASVLYLFGLVAFVPFLLILVGSLRSSYRIFRRAATPAVRSTGLFCFLFLVYYMFPLVVEGTGGDPLLFGIVGIVSGLSLRVDSISATALDGTLARSA
jgi:O-antigen ligase